MRRSFQFCTKKAVHNKLIDTDTDKYFPCSLHLTPLQRIFLLLTHAFVYPKNDEDFAAVPRCNHEAFIA